jgi:hypothetical protein
MMNWILDHLWPFSVIRELRRQRDSVNAHFLKAQEFGDACCALLDQVHTPWRHIRLDGKLYIMGVDTVSVMERCDASVVFYRTAEGIQEFVAKSTEQVSAELQDKGKVDFDA